MKAIPFMKWRWVAVALSAATLLAAIGSLSVRQLNWGLDFTGGTLVEVAYSDSTTDRSGSVVDRTEPGSLTITYILGRDGDQWRLTAYIPQG